MRRYLVIARGVPWNARLGVTVRFTCHVERMRDIPIKRPLTAESIKVTTSCNTLQDGAVRKIASHVMPSVSEASLPGDPSLSLGMTKRRAGMTKRRAGMTKRRAGMTKRRARSDSLFYLSWNECEASHKRAHQFFV